MQIVILLLAIFEYAFGIADIWCQRPHYYKRNHSNNPFMLNFPPHIFEYLPMAPIVASPFYIDKSQFYSKAHEQLFTNA